MSRNRPRQYQPTDGLPSDTLHGVQQQIRDGFKAFCLRRGLVAPRRFGHNAAKKVSHEH